MSDSIVRLLSIPRGATCDADGRELGDDWLLADLGVDLDLTAHYLTTDHVPGSEIPPVLDDARRFGEMLVELINTEWKER